MWKLSKFVFLSSFLFLLPVLTSAQECTLSISGFVKDVSTGNPISYANIYIKEAYKGAVVDDGGNFRIESLCATGYHLTISHIGCETQEIYLNLKGDTTLTIYLDHNSQLLNEVAIVGEGGKVTTQETQSLNSESITQNSDKNLATMLESITGVSAIKNGSGIAKPVIQGLSGNRVAILNNGITQSGQQWGVDHSPEIDPLVANKITVVKGVGTLEYQGSSLGAVILVEPKKIEREPHLHGEGRYFFETNGLGNGLNLELRQYSDIVAWRVVGTLKKNGDTSTPDYYLRNTGNQEANIAAQFEKEWNNKWSSDLYFSSFNAEYGILRGSQIGNLTDLETALERDEPFYTEENFTYSIDAPYQKVNHHLLKFHTRYQINESQSLNITYAGQYDLRKEFDVRRAGRSDMPAMSLEQFSNFGEVKYQNYLEDNWELKSGVQLNRVDNTNIPETGILPLIPDYISHEYGVFAMLFKRYEKTSLEFGGRYDFENRNVAAISVTVPREIIRQQDDYNNLSAIFGVTHTIFKGWKASYNIGLTSRNPEVNELFSNGLHQGVGGIEEGDPNLTKEISLKNTLSVKGKVKERFFFESLFYYQRINDYIFLNPTDEFRLTIRGAFPVFKYEQADAEILGFDLAGTFQATQRLNITAKYSYLYGYNLSENIPLVYMPSNNLFAGMDYQIPEWGKFQNVGFHIDGKYVFQQKNLLPDQDFVAPPPSYFLLGAKVSAERQLNKLRLNMFVKAENLLNTSYRDYLNWQRYFADDLGINVVLGINISF